MKKYLIAGLVTLVHSTIIYCSFKFAVSPVFDVPELPAPGALFLALWSEYYSVKNK